MNLFPRGPGVLGDRQVPRSPTSAALVFRQYFFRTEDSPARPTSVPARNSLDEAGGGDKDVIDRWKKQLWQQVVGSRVDSRQSTVKDNEFSCVER